MLFIIYKYVYFQKSCINIIQNAKSRQVAVLSVSGSPLNIQVNAANTTIPDTNDTNLAGQNSPANECTAVLVASMNNHVIGTPNSINTQRYVFANGQSIGPLTCIHTSDCPIKNKTADVMINL